MNRNLKIIFSTVVFSFLATLFLLFNGNDPFYFNEIFGGNVGKYDKGAYVISFPSSTYMKEDVILYDGWVNGSFPYIGRIVALPKEKFVQRGKTYIVPDDSYYVLGHNYTIDEVYEEIEFTHKSKIRGKVRFCVAKCYSDTLVVSR